MSWSVRIRAHAGTLPIEVDFEGGTRPMALVGPNGSGKTTVLRILAGVHPAHDGHIEVDDQVWWSSEAGIDRPPEARGVGYVPQGYGLFPHLTVLHNVAFGLSTGPRQLPPAERTARARQALAEVDCAGLADRRPRRLSGGERQRVALARALVIDPALLLLDEPLAALDAPNRRAVRSLLVEHLARLARPTLVVTHDVRDVAALNADVVVLHEGAVVQRGTLDTLQAAPANDFVREFLGPSV